MKVFVTGNMGYVGSVLTRFLNQMHPSIEIVGYDAGFFCHSLTGADFIPELGVAIQYFGDVRDIRADMLNDVDAVVHLAGVSNDPIGHEFEDVTEDINRRASVRLAEMAAAAGVKNFVFASSCSMYGQAEGGARKETDPTNPLTPYAAAKAALYLSLSQSLPPYSVEFAWCRLFYLFGEGEDPRRLVPYLRSKLEKGEPAELTSGKQIRDFLDVSEAGRRIANVALGHQSGAINICSGTPVTVRQLAERIADEYGRRDLLRFGARPDNLVDPPCVLGICTL